MPTVIAPPQIRLRNILFATDLDLSAQAALFCALDLARRYKAALFTVNVMPHLPFVEAAEPDPEKIKLEAMKKLAALAEPFEGIPHEELIEQGEVPGVLSRLAEEKDIDLIVIGTGARKGLGKFLLGSVAEQVFRTPHARCSRWDRMSPTGRLTATCGTFSLPRTSGRSPRMLCPTRFLWRRATRLA